MGTLRHGLWAGLCALLLAACTTPPGSPSAAETTLTAPMTLARHYAVSGRFSARNGEQQASGQFQLNQDGDRRRLVIFTPLGSVAAEIEADAHGAQLIDAQGQRLQAATLADLLRTVIDVPLREAELAAWLQGVPLDPARLQAADSERDGQGLPLRFNEAGWDIVVNSREVAADDGWAGPLRMRWALRAQPDTEVRWLIDGWTRP